jgi:hypothetical protein
MCLNPINGLLKSNKTSFIIYKMYESTLHINVMFMTNVPLHRYSLTIT